MFPKKFSNVLNIKARGLLVSILEERAYEAWYYMVKLWGTLFVSVHMLCRHE